MILQDNNEISVFHPFCHGVSQVEHSDLFSFPNVRMQYQIKFDVHSHFCSLVEEWDKSNVNIYKEGPSVLDVSAELQRYEH